MHMLTLFVQHGIMAHNPWWLSQWNSWIALSNDPVLINNVTFPLFLFHWPSVRPLLPHECMRQLIIHFTYQEYTTITNMSIAARTVLPLPRPGDRSELEIKEPLGLHIWSEKNNKDLRNIWHISDQIITVLLHVMKTTNFYISCLFNKKTKFIMGTKDVVFLVTCLINAAHNSSVFKPIHFPSAAFLAKTHTLVPPVISNFLKSKENNILLPIWSMHN